MALTLRSTKGSALTYIELDNNFLTLSASIASSNSGSYTGSYTGSFTGSYTGSFTGSFSGSHTGTTILPVYLISASVSSSQTFLSFGINHVNTVEMSKDSVYLPDGYGQTGKSIDVVNRGNQVLRVFPYTNGGKEIPGVIGNLPTGSFTLIPPDGQQYRFTVVSSSASRVIWSPLSPPGGSTYFTITGPEFVINHTSGSNSTVFGVRQTYTASYNNNLYPTCAITGTLILDSGSQYWSTYRVRRAWITNFSMETNVVRNDATNFNPNTYIESQVHTVFGISPLGSGLYYGYHNPMAAYALVGPYSGQQVSGGLAYSGEIGDNTTLYDAGNPYQLFYGFGSASLEIGRGTPYGDPDSPPTDPSGLPVDAITSHYYTFKVIIPASFKTKTYKIQPTITGFYTI